MRIVIQRVKKASVEINQHITARINTGLLVLVGIEEADTTEDSSWLAGKLTGLRIFDDENGIMNRSVLDIEGEILIVSQFTLHALTKKGNRPSYIKVAGHATAIPLYQHFCNATENLLGKAIQTGIFGADMLVSLENNGPVTIIIDSKNKE